MSARKKASSKSNPDVIAAMASKIKEIEAANVSEKMQAMLHEIERRVGHNDEEMKIQ